MNLTTCVSIRCGAVCRVLILFLFVCSALVDGSTPLQAAKAPRPADKDRVPQGGVNASDWQSIHAAHEAWQHAIEPVNGGWQAHNPAQRWTTTFDGCGFDAKPQGADWTWGLELRSYGAGEDQREVKGKAAVKAEGHRLAYRWDDTVQEWYVNDGRGLQHGFSVQERPPGPADAPLRFVLATRGPLRAAVTGDARAVDYRDASGATVLTYSGLRVWDADGRELAARFTPSAEGVTLQVDASGARYPLLIDPIAQQAYLKASNIGANDRFGESVAICGDTVVVGAIYENGGATGVGGDQTDNSASNSGAAYVFVRGSDGIWTQQAYLKASNTGANDEFGGAVAISGDTLVVGARGEGSGATGVGGSQADNSAFFSGAAYVFVRRNGAWTQQAYLKASNTGANDLFGGSVAISGETLVVGARVEDSGATGVDGNQADNSAVNSGAAYIFARSNGTWTQQAYLKASNTGANDEFGRSVGISGDTVVVGASLEDSSTTGVGGNQADNSAVNSGAAYVFVRNGDGTWTQQAYLKASNTGTGDEFGRAVAISGDTVVVGASSEDSSASGVDGSQTDNSAANSGAAFVFVRSNGTWARQAYLKASNTGAGDEFGRAVAISGDTVVVGAYVEDSSAAGVGGNPTDNSASAAGAAYGFMRSDGAWTQQAYLKASNTAANDLFGGAVAISGGTAVAGAVGESSNGSGPLDNSAFAAGAAYVFIGLGPAPVITGATAATGQVGVVFLYQIATSGGTPMSYGAVGLPAGLNINPITGVVTGTPTAAGTFNVNLSATNAGGAGMATLTLTIAAAPAPPAPSPSPAPTPRSEVPPTGPDKLAPALKFSVRPQYSKARSFALSALVRDDRAPKSLSYRVKPPGSKNFLPWRNVLLGGSGLTRKWSTPLGLSKEGRWEVQVQAIDAAGNKSKVGTMVVIADRTKPTAIITSAPSVTSRSYRLRANLADRTQLASVRYRLQAPKAKRFGPWSTVKLRGNKRVQAWSRPLTLPRIGAWQIQLQAIDAAGNASKAAAVKVNRAK